jgi:hypothetical protein
MTSRHHWRTEFATAMALSTAAVIALTGFLMVAGMPQANHIPRLDHCSITSGLISRDGASILLTYWQSDRGRKSLRRGLARLNLRDPGHIQAVPTRWQPWRLVSFGSCACYVGEAPGRMALQPIDVNDEECGRAILLPGSSTAELATSADGKTVVAWTTDSLQAFDVDRQSIRWQRDKDVECFVLHARCGLIAALGSQIVELSLKNGAVLRTITRLPQRVRLLAIDPSGSSLACLDWNGAIEMIRLRDGTSIWRQDYHAAQSLPPTHRPALYGRVLAFSSDGRYLATAACEGEWVLGIWNTRTGARVRTLRGHDDTINGADFLPDGSLASWSTDGTLRLWNVQRGVVRRVFRAQELPPLVDLADAGAA